MDPVTRRLESLARPAARRVERGLLHDERAHVDEVVRADVAGLHEVAVALEHLPELLVLCLVDVIADGVDDRVEVAAAPLAKLVGPVGLVASHEDVAVGGLVDLHALGVLAHQRHVRAARLERLRRPKANHAVAHDDGEGALAGRAPAAVVAHLREHEAAVGDGVRGVGDGQDLAVVRGALHQVPTEPQVRVLGRRDGREACLAFLQAADLRAHPLHHANLLVAGHHGERPRRVSVPRAHAVDALAAQERALRAVADPRVRRAHDDVLGAGVRKFDRAVAHLADALENHALGLHCHVPCREWWPTRRPTRGGRRRAGHRRRARARAGAGKSRSMMRARPRPEVR